VHCGYPEGRVGAVLLIELDGPAAEVEAELATVRAICEAGGARGRSGRRTTPAQRAGIWAGRKSAFARGRAPLPPPTSCRTAWCRAPRSATVLARIAKLSAETGIRVANVFHAGDGKPAPAGALQRRRARRGRTGGNGLWCHPRHVHRVRRVDHRRARPSGWINPAICRKCSARRTWTPCSSSAAPSTPASLCNPGKIFPTPRPLRRGSRVTAAVPVPPARAARRSFNEIPNECGFLAHASRLWQGGGHEYWCDSRGRRYPRRGAYGVAANARVPLGLL